MNRIASHLRNKLVAGAIAVIPLAIVVIAAIYIEQYSKALAAPFGIKFPGMGALIAIASVYVLGVIVTSVLGQFVLSKLNYILLRVPGLNMIYRVWKEVLVSPLDKNGIFHMAVLVPTWHNQVQLGFTNNDPLPDDPNSICVLLPNIPNPFSGRMIIVKRDSCVFLNISVEEAMKFQLSTANYLPPGLEGVRAAKFSIENKGVGNVDEV